MTASIRKTQVSYNILIKQNKVFLNIGKIIIKRLDGDILYVPSNRGLIRQKSSLISKMLEHFSWHKSGRVHIKYTDQSLVIFEKGRGEILKEETTSSRQEIKNIGFQEVIRDIVFDVSKLPIYIKKVDNLDVVFEVESNIGPVEFIFSIVSGKQLVRLFEGKETPVRAVGEEEKEHTLGQAIRCLGKESDNADKLLQYTLKKSKINISSLPKHRELIIPKDSGISN